MNAPSLGSRFTLKINSDEAYLLNTKKEQIPKKEDIEVEISFKDFLSENNFGYSEEETGMVFDPKFHPVDSKICSRKFRPKPQLENCTRK